MSKKILVSIIIPAHNTEQYLADCLSSVISQTHEHLEIIIINDSSIDSTAQIIKEYVAKDKRIRSYYQDNHNAALTRQKGIAESTGKYICFVDGDDIINPRYVQQLLATAHENNAMIASAKIGTFRGELDTKSDNYIDTDTVQFESNMLMYFSENYHSIDNRSRQIAQSINAKIFKREILESIDYSVLKTSVLEDNYIVPQILKKVEGEGIALLDSTLYYYRINSESTMAKVLDGYIQYGKDKVHYPKLFDITMEYVKNIFSAYPDVDAKIDKIRAKQYYNLSQHIYSQNKKINQLKTEVDDLSHLVSHLKNDLEYIIQEKTVIEESRSYRLSRYLARFSRTGKRVTIKLRKLFSLGLKEKK